MDKLLVGLLALCLLASPAWGAVAVVQEFESPAVSTAATPTVTAGHLLVAVFTYDGSSPSFSDGLGDSPVVIAGEQVGADGGKTQVIGFVAGSSAAASVSMSQTGGSFWIVIGEEVSGQDATTPIDNQSSIILDAPTATFDRSLTLSNTNDLMIAYEGAATGQAIITTAGYTSDGGSAFGNDIRHKTIASSGSTTVSFDNAGWPGPAISTDAILIAVQATSGGGGGGPVVPHGRVFPFRR